MEEEEQKLYGGFIVMMRHRYHISQRELAQKAKVTPSTIARIETGKYNPGLILANRIEKALGLKRCYFDQNGIPIGNPEDNSVGKTFYPKHPVEFFNAIKDLRCFQHVQLSANKKCVNAFWNLKYKDEQDGLEKAELMDINNVYDTLDNEYEESDYDAEIDEIDENGRHYINLTPEDHNKYYSRENDFDRSSQRNENTDDDIELPF